MLIVNVMKMKKKLLAMAVSTSMFSHWRARLLNRKSLFFLMICGISCDAVLANDYFDPSLLSLIGQDDVDLDIFTKPGGVPEGEYIVDVYLNGHQVTSQSIAFKNNEDGVSIPQLTPAMLRTYGVELSGIEFDSDDAPIGELSALLPYAKSEFTFSQLRLDLTIPQKYIYKVVNGYIDPSMLDNGVMAAMFNYTLNASKNWQTAPGSDYSSQSQNLYGNANGGLNVGPWRLRSSINLSQSESNSGQYRFSTQSSQISGTHVYRSFPEITSVLDMGQLGTGGDILDGVPMVGVKLTSDDSMQPWVQRGFSPVITGVAQSNALVTITQNGRMIHQSNVAPGPFQIDDLYQAGSAGDLVVTLTESDGTKRVWTEAYSSLPMMLQQNSYRYEIAVGRYDNGGSQHAEQPMFAMGSMAVGLPHGMTLYSGGLLAKNYQSLALGAGFSLGEYGALSADVTGARAILPDTSSDAVGASYSIKYSKSMLSTGSTVDLTSYRYATRNYYSFSDVNNYNVAPDDEYPWLHGRQRSSWQMNLSQSLGEFGSISLRGSWDDYWNMSDVQKSLSTSFNSMYEGISYSIAYSMDRRVGDTAQPINRQLSLNLSVPVSLFAANDSTRGKYLNYSMNHSNDGRTSQYVTGNGHIDKLSYSISAGMGNQGQSTTGSVGVGYVGDLANFNGGYNVDRYTQGVNASLSGGLLVHQQGITFTQSMGDTVALLSVPGVEGTSSSSGMSKTNSSGYALLPYMNAYNKNVVSLDPTTLPDDVDVARNSVNLYPTRGAVVLAEFKPRRGQQAFLTLAYKDGVVPFGAAVELEGDSESRTIVGEDGEVYITGLPQKGVLQVKWGSDADKQCSAEFDFRVSAASKPEQGILQASAICQ